MVTGHHQEKSPYSPLPVINTSFGFHWGGILVLGIIVPLHLMGFCKGTAFAYAWPVPIGALGLPHTSLS